MSQDTTLFVVVLIASAISLAIGLTLNHLYMRKHPEAANTWSSVPKPKDSPAAMPFLMGGIPIMIAMIPASFFFLFVVIPFVVLLPVLVLGIFALEAIEKTAWEGWGIVLNTSTVVVCVTILGLTYYGAFTLAQKISDRYF